MKYLIYSLIFNFSSRGKLFEIFWCCNFVSVDCLVVCAVKSGELEWLPEGSQLSMASPAQSGDKQKTFTSFSQSQKEILEKPIGVKFEDITIARLGPGQVNLFRWYRYHMNSCTCIFWPS